MLSTRPRADSPVGPLVLRADCWGRWGDERRDQPPEALDFDSDFIARLQPHARLRHTQDYPFRSAGNDDITWVEGHVLAGVAHDLGHGKDHVRGAGVLPQLSIHPGAQFELLGVRY